ncbi:hypothetical protein [Kitasatospora phosalacinea]|uniref:DprA winged helix domain-containing protein n=1 Tax=Kitasatospora phosalacinea TaxID=2065 RepID=A0A9W6PFE6_9ACTN|nr:hypothetical protein [Kitasatospora phosalacinea]GLW55010.1 hypothetical protein Kpho01_30210 [Kitasatospora phosalacinea]
MTQPEAPAPDAALPVLHALRCAGAVSVARVAAVTGLDPSDAESELIDLGIDGLVTRLPGDPPVWSLTGAGRAAGAERIARELESARARGRVTAAYERFMVLNPELLDLCTAWQLRPVDGVTGVNDHTDAEYDSRVLARFADLDGRAAAVCAELAAALPRFGRYRARLAEALGRAAAGETAYLADNTASYHLVWAELHEDLLVTLGRERW